MFRHLALAAIAPALLAAPALAEIDSGTLGACMVAHSTEAQASAMKDFMVHALEERREEATDALLGLAFGAAAIATTDCGAGFADLDTPAFEDAMEIYGEHLGTIIMERALAYMDIPLE